MSIKKVDSRLPRQTQINDLNDMVIEVNGKTVSAEFDKNELDQIFDNLNLSRKFLRNQVIGNTTTTYTGWSHLLEETGYSIWKYTPTTYAYNSNNRLYFDNKVLELRGEAGAESATAFDYVYLYNGDSGPGFTDDTTKAASAGGTAFSLVDTVNDYLYIGDASTFSGIKFEFNTRGSGTTLKLEYWSGSAWTTLSSDDNDLDDDTSNFESDGKISWTTPTDWATTTVNSQSAYWVRISSTTTPVTTATAYYIIPYNSVPGLLALSNSQIVNEDWAWCSYGSSIYVTIRNAIA